MPHTTLALILGAPGFTAADSTVGSTASIHTRATHDYRITGYFSYSSKAWDYRPHGWTGSGGGGGITLTHSTASKGFTTRAFLEGWSHPHDALIVACGLIRQTEVSYSAIDRPLHATQGVRVLYSSLKELPHTNGGYRPGTIERKGTTLSYF